jgi:hypothetical protein
MLVVDVMAVLLQRGVHAVLRGRDAVQAHQAAWTLLNLLGVTPDTSGCSCLACGGAALILSHLDLVVGSDESGLTGLPRPYRETEGDGSPVPPPPGEDETPQ